MEREFALKLPLPHNNARLLTALGAVARNNGAHIPMHLIGNRPTIA